MLKAVVLPLFYLQLLIASFSFADDCPTILKEPEAITLGEMRVKFIQSWDKLLTWALSPRNIPFVLQEPLVEKWFKVDGKDLFSFRENYGYFSIYQPIVGIVTTSARDIKATQCLLNAIPNEITDSEQLRFTTHEILAKIMAYRALKKGMKIALPILQGEMTSYFVDEVIDLWRGMPAFGLVPEKEGLAPPILVYRGTDHNLTTERGWASIMSDLDVAGPGHATFLKAQKEIHAWLEKMYRNKKPAILSGFSLGGAFVLYTLIYEHALINKEMTSVAFNPPGINYESLKKWDKIPLEQRPPHTIYVNQGDFVSQIGFFLPNAWEIFLNHPMNIIEAHTTFISAQPFFKMSAVNVEQENKNRKIKLDQ